MSYGFIVEIPSRLTPPVGDWKRRIEKLIGHEIDYTDLSITTGESELLECTRYGVEYDPHHRHKRGAAIPVPAEGGAESAPEPAIKDSGDRTQFDSGAVRDMHEGKGRCDLLPMCALLRLARHYENGCKKYGDRNWEKGIPAHSFADSALRHMLKYMDGMDDEDHLIAAVWNLLGLAWTEEKHPEMMDIPARAGKADFTGMFVKTGN